VSLIDITAIEKEAADEFRKESSDKAKAMLKAQMRVVANAERVLNAERLKLDDIKQQICDGTL